LSTERPPTPPDPALLDPLVETWERDKPWFRCHNVELGATEFNPGFGRGRFHPFTTPAGAAVPSLYGAGTLDGALSESVFHSVPVRGPRRLIRSSALLPMVVSTLAAKRDLVLAQLHGFGLGRLAISRSALIDTGPRHYPATALWAQALHRCQTRIDGLIWVSRLHDTSLVLVLFGDRVLRTDLLVVKSPVPLYDGPGLATVREAAEHAAITVVD
jgi:hypothetical protein